MSEQLLKQILGELQKLNQRFEGIEKRVGGIENEVQGVKSQMNSRFDTAETKASHMQASISDIQNSVDALSEKISVQHIESINADTLLLNEIRSIREGVVYVNRKVADTEFELNMMKQSTKQ